MLRELTLQRPGLLAALAKTKTALVVPAFEISLLHALPKSQSTLATLVNSKAASPFHEAHFPKGHAPTDSARWMRAAALFVVDYHDYYEPYIIASRAWLPRYDERFRGYGMNKVPIYMY